MEILKNYSLKNLNTFGFESIAKFYTKVRSVPELKDVLRDSRFISENIFVLGGGSNVLFTKDFDGLVIHMGVMGVEISSEDDEKIVFKVGAGENWDDFVKFTVEEGYFGLENLSFIPGSVGASCIQNIGAYGKEAKEFIKKVLVLNRDTLKVEELSNADCGMGYRTSAFKTKFKDKYIVTHVFLELSKKQENFNLDYSGVKEQLLGKEINAKNIRNAIISIRKEKLPDPKVLGNAGSFFKNVEMEVYKLEELKKKFPLLKDVPIYPSPIGVKIPTAWLIDKCGFKGKGKKEGSSVGSYEKQALILVNYGGTGQQMKLFALEIQNTVYEKFGIKIVPEVCIV